MPEAEAAVTMLAPLLVKMSALAGVAVPLHRFAFPEASADGIELASLAPSSQAIELWKIRFPDGPSQALTAEEITKPILPLLWVKQGDGDLDARIIRGIQNQGFLVESADGETAFFDAAEIAAGTTLKLQIGSSEMRAGDADGLTARQLFYKALIARRSVFFEAVFATLMLSIFGLMSALYTMQVYDRVVPTNGFSTLWVLTIGVLLAILFEFAMKIVRAQMVDRASKVIDVELSSVFFGKAMDIRAESRPRTVGTFAAQIRHFESVRNFMTSTTLFILADAPFALFFIFVIYLIAGEVAIVPLLMLPLGLALGLGMKGRVEKYAAETMEESNKKNGLLIEAIDGIESVKAVSAEWKIKERWRNLTLDISSSELKTKLITSIATSSTQTVHQLSYVGVIAVGAYLISQGDITMGALIACSIISGRALTPLAQIPSLIVKWKQAKIALNVLDQIMAMPSEQNADRHVVPDACTGHISVSELAFSYDINARPLEVAKLDIKPGDRIAVLGAVGSGKSTLLKLLAGLYRPKAGRAFLDGTDMQLIAVEFLREQIGYLPQEVRLFNGSLRENLVLGLPVLSDSQILATCQKTGLDSVIRSHYQGLDIMISEGGKGLSGGQRQLVGLTRMLLAKPKVILLDEPTASMDGALEAKVMDYLFEKVDDNSVVIMATHKSAAMKHVNRIIVVEGGRVAIDGPRDKVIEELNRQAAERSSK